MELPVLSKEVRVRYLIPEIGTNLRKNDEVEQQAIYSSFEFECENDHHEHDSGVQEVLENVVTRFEGDTRSVITCQCMKWYTVSNKQHIT